MTRANTTYFQVTDASGYYVEAYGRRNAMTAASTLAREGHPRPIECRPDGRKPLGHYLTVKGGRK